MHRWFLAGVRTPPISALPGDESASTELALQEILRSRLEGMGEIVGTSRRMQEVFELIRRAAPARSNILITGESGTGKELVARAIHRLSPRDSNPFVPVHTSAIPSELLESSLFGHVKGAFTGAVSSRKGLFEAAHQGTLFLDEVGTINPETQTKLLRVIQEREIRRVGRGAGKRWPRCHRGTTGDRGWGSAGRWCAR